jgi:predicted nucleic acid-binding protein
MRVEKVVTNASPFILLCKSGLVDLLPELFSEIYMPERVSIEIIEGNDIAAEKLHDYEETWILRVLPTVAEEVLIWNLGNGETDVLSFAYGNENITALVDDRAARKCAATLNIKTLGTGGILLLAKNRGLIDSVGEALEELQNAGLYISNEIVELLRKQAGELD